MYDEMMNKIHNKRMEFINNGIDIFELCGEIQMNPDTMFMFIRDAQCASNKIMFRPHSFYASEGIWKVYGMDLKGNPDVPEKDLKFVLK